MNPFRHPLLRNIVPGVLILLCIGAAWAVLAWIGCPYVWIGPAAVVGGLGLAVALACLLDWIAERKPPF